jgi:hypothetical protein
MGQTRIGKSIFEKYTKNLKTWETPNRDGWKPRMT